MRFESVWAVYFSACGSTRRALRAMAKAAGEALALPVRELDYTLPPAREQNYAFGEGDLIFWGSPTYAGRLPNVLLPFLRGHFTGGGAAAVAVVLYGNCDYDDALKELCEVLSGNGFCPAAAAAMVGEHAFAPALAHGRPDAEDIAAAEAFARNAAHTLRERERPIPAAVPGREPIGPYYTPLGLDGEPARFLKAKPVTDPASCTRCGLCAAVCPMGSIPREEPTECTGICIKCQGCIRECPAGAKYFADAAFCSHRAMLGSRPTQNGGRTNSSRPCDEYTFAWQEQIRLLRI